MHVVNMWRQLMLQISRWKLIWFDIILWKTKFLHFHFYHFEAALWWYNVYFRENRLFHKAAENEPIFKRRVVPLQIDDVVLPDVVVVLRWEYKPTGYCWRQLGRISDILKEALLSLEFPNTFLTYFYFLSDLMWIKIQKTAPRFAY